MFRSALSAAALSSLACLPSARTGSGWSQAAVTALSPCNEHVLVRNHEAESRRVRLVVGNDSRDLLAGGRDTSTNRPYAGTVVVFAEGTAPITLYVGRGAPIRIERSDSPCVRDLPDTNPDSTIIDYAEASARRDRVGVIIVSFRGDAPRAELNALIRRYQLALIGGRRAVTSDGESWIFWIADSAENSRTHQLVAELRRSPLVRSAVRDMLILQ